MISIAENLNMVKEAELIDHMWLDRNWHNVIQYDMFAKYWK